MANIASYDSYSFPFLQHVIVLDCGTPNASSGVVFEQLNSTEFALLVIFRCQDGLKPDDIVTAVCRSSGVWTPNPAHHVCVNQSGNDIYACYRAIANKVSFL